MELDAPCFLSLTPLVLEYLLIKQTSNSDLASQLVRPETDTLMPSIGVHGWGLVTHEPL